MTTTEDARRVRANELECEARRLRQEADAADRRYWRALAWVLADRWGDELLKDHTPEPRPARQGESPRSVTHAIDPDQLCSLAPTVEMVGAIHTEVTWDDGYPEQRWTMTATCTCGTVLAHQVKVSEAPFGEIVRALVAVPISHVNRPKVP